MMKKILAIFIILVLVACNNDEESYRQLKVEGEKLNYQVEKNGDDYLIPLNLVLDELSISYVIEENTIFFGDIELTLDSDIALVNNNARELNYPVTKEGNNILISLDFLINNLQLSYVEDNQSVNIRILNELLLTHEEALEIFTKGSTVEVFDILSQESFNVRRVEANEKITIADVEPVTAEDTAILLEIIGGEWNHIRRPILIKIDETIIAAAIVPFPHSGRDDRPFGEEVDNRSGHTGTGPNLNSIRDNDVNGVIDIFFLNSMLPGVNRIDERAQEKVFEAAYFYR